MDYNIQNCNFTCRQYGCEAWSVILSDGHRQRMIEITVLGRIFGPKRDQLTGG